MALQLTNICRDVGEDTDRDRVYLPEDELARFRVRVEDLYAHTGGAAFGALMRFQTDRARSCFRQANPLPSMVRRDSRLAVRLMGLVYARILDAIARHPDAVLHRRVRLDRLDRARVVVAGLLRRPFVVA
jgi:phytoene synthase